MGTRVVVSGKFDPLHDGHIQHILMAAQLGDELKIIVQPDSVVRKVKGKCNIPLWARAIIARGILDTCGIGGDVFTCVDKDGSCAESIKLLKPQIYAKGGGYTEKTMNPNELEACKEIGCKIVYGIGDRLNNSSKMEVKHKDANNSPTP